jgi:hypothetical protein
MSGTTPGELKNESILLKWELGSLEDSAPGCKEKICHCGENDPG